MQYESIEQQFSDWLSENLESYVSDNIDVVAYSGFLSDTFDCGEWGDHSLTLQQQDKALISQWRDMIKKWQDEQLELRLPNLDY
tara:strand:+ start:764 stop:1015 length:252 start_codon:yes stop_codon:yes gene_type:complete